MDDYDDVDEFDEDSSDFDEDSYFNDDSNFDDDSDEIDDDSDETDDDSDNLGTDVNRVSELEELGVMDGQQDGISGSYYTGFGMSVDDLDSLSDEERDAYESGYIDGFNAAGGWG